MVFLNYLFIEKDQIKIEITQLNLERAKYKNLVDSLLKQEERPLKNETFLTSVHLKNNNKHIQLKRTRTAPIFEYLGRISKIKHGIKILPLISHIFRENDKFKAQKKDLQMEIEKYRLWAQFLSKRKRENIKNNIATIIQYSTIDYKFIKYCINEAMKFSNQVIVTVADCFFDGTPEDKELLEKTVEENKMVEFVKIKFDPSFHPPFTRYWFAFSVVNGLTRVNKDIEYVLLLDTDEIIEGDRFKDWLNNFNYKDYNAIKFAAYWYFRETKFRALSVEWAGLLVKRSLLINKVVLHPWLRFGMYFIIPRKKISNVLGIDDEPMVHHYSWVRTKKEMLKKVSTWGHKNDRNWKPLVEKEFQRKFTEDSVDFVFGFKYQIVKPYIEFNK